MSNELRLVFFLVAVVLFAVDAVRLRSFGWAGLAVVTCVPLWDAIEAT